MTKDSIQFQSGDKVGFVYDNKLCEGTFVAYEMDNSEAIVNYNGTKLRFSDCSIYAVNAVTNTNFKKTKHGYSKTNKR